jgi:hypothetical protein
MGKDKEPLDSLVGRIANGIHQAAAATICAGDATREELDLAALILRRDPKQSAPREASSMVETFNRLLDVAIDSANASAHCGTRAERRARLATDLGRASVLLLDSSTLAELVNAKLDLDKIKLGLIVEPPGPIPLLEALEPTAEDLELEEEELHGTVPASSFRPRDYQPASVVIDE